MDVPASIEIEEGERVVLTWEDGSSTTVGARELRRGCQCASCREPGGRAATQAVLEGQQSILIRQARLVGAYAVSFVFEPDAHGTGIYTFDMLRELGETLPPS
ncbi:MAG: DUF971 domain-containing protein [Actinomycetota bacterium]|nr:DUF971 domain-containing protein [Actinomycetota bacterium]